MATNQNEQQQQKYTVQVKAAVPGGWHRGGVLIPNNEAGIGLEVDETIARQLQIDASMGKVVIMSGGESLPMKKDEVEAAKMGRPAPARPAARVVETGRAATPAAGERLASPGEGHPGDMMKKGPRG